MLKAMKYRIYPSKLQKQSKNFKEDYQKRKKEVKTDKKSN